MKRTMAILGTLMLIAVPALAGEWHSGVNNLCTDCHTMHFSMQHEWDGTPGPVSTTGQSDGNWLGISGPNDYLLKAPVNDLCLSCHNGQSFAPDVLGTNFNASPSEGRMAGALNRASEGAPYEIWKGHTLDSTDAPPGYNPDVLDAGLDPHPAGTALECVSCHAQHGDPASYRNLGPFSWGFAAYSQARPTYEIAAVNTTTTDVSIGIASHTPNSGLPATFNPYYDFANVSYNNNGGLTTTAGNQYANTMENFCAACHGNFHGGPTDATVGGTVDAPGWSAFQRHPSNVTIGLLGGGHSGLDFYANVLNVSKVKTYTTDYAGYTDASPGCVSCHKAHGNQNPFGLFFLSATAGAITEQGGYAAAGDGVIGNELANGYGVGLMNMCGQCHTQGINYNE